MLILQRKKGEALLLNDDIKISVLEVGTDSVKLSIEAPKEVKILREELAEAMKVNKEAATSKEAIQKLKGMLYKNEEVI